GLLYMFARADYRQGEPSLRGQPEKDFALTLDGKPARLSDLRGQVVLLNFWATLCPPCVDEAPSLNALQRLIAPRGGTVLGISLDEDQTAYDNFLKIYHLGFQTFRDPPKRTPWVLAPQIVVRRCWGETSLPPPFLQPCFPFGESARSMVFEVSKPV